MKRLIAAGMITALLASAGAVFAQTEEPGVQLSTAASKVGPAAAGNFSGSEAGMVPVAAPSRHDVSLLSEEAPKAMQEWTGNNPKIVPGNWKGDGVIVVKICDDSDSMADGLTETGDRVLIKVRTPAAFRPGDMLASYIKGAPVYDTKTGKELGVKLQKTGILKVMSVRGKKITARIVKAGTSVDKGQLITK
jgi:hypothetical protein